MVAGRRETAESACFDHAVASAPTTDVSDLVDDLEDDFDEGEP